MQFAILSGIYTDNGPDVRVSYPVNMVPVPGANGVSNGYLKPAEGLVSLGSGAGVTRGQINWQGVLYAVQGTSLVSIAEDGTLLTLGTVADGGPVRMVYSFDLLAIASGGKLYYWDLSTLTEVTDPDVGVVVDVVWIDGYFMVTDGEFIAVSDLTAPTSFNPLNYGSSEASPDPVVGLLRLRNEISALNRNTIEVFDDVGGLGFPFQRVTGAQVQKGAIGTFTSCVFVEAIAFLGSGFNEAPGIYIAANAGTQKISTFEIDKLLATYSELDLSTVVMEARNDSAHQHLYIHLPDRCIVFDAAASQAFGESVWFTLTSSIVGFSAYKARYFTWCYDRWNIGDPTTTSYGYVDDTVSTHYGDNVRWEFATGMLYNESAGAVISELELVALPGRVALGAQPQITTSYSFDGMTWSPDVSIEAGMRGQRLQRLCWRRQGSMLSTRMQRFQGNADAHLSFLRLEAAVQPLRW